MATSAKSLVFGDSLDWVSMAVDEDVWPGTAPLSSPGSWALHGMM